MLNFIIKKNLTETTLNNKNKDLKFGCYYEPHENTIEFAYIKNCCLKHPVPFDVPFDIDQLQQICFMFSFNDFSYLKTSTLIDHNFIGLIPENTNIPILFVDIKSNNFQEQKYKFFTRKYRFNKEVKALNIDEQIKLSLHMVCLYNTEKCEYLRKIKTQAYLDRLLFCENEKHFLLTRLYIYFESLINHETKYLEEILEQNFFKVDSYLLKIPLIFRRDLELNLANIYFKLKYFESSLIIFKKLNMIQEEIECLINLKKTDEAIVKIKQHMKIIKNENNILFCNYCIKLGHMTKDINYFDLGYEAYKSFEPLKEKAIFLHTNNQFNKAKIEYQKVLKIVPQNESVLYGYASVKVILKEYLECIDIFLRLIEMNKTNPEYHRNLALCYYNVNNVDKCLKSLKKNSLRDPTSLDLFFKICIKNRNKEGILWYINKIKDENIFKKLISFLLIEKYINENEAAECARNNNFNI